ncbi:MAG: GTPase [Myxococcales bacterium]|nr:GTPase [Myxococcales bacterium]
MINGMAREREERSGLLDELGAALAAFDEAFAAAGREACAARDEVVALLGRSHEIALPEGIPTRLHAIVQEVVKTIETLDEKAREEHAEFLRAENLAGRFEDVLLVVVVGPVKSGKSTLMNQLVRIFEQGLGRPVERFVLDEPSEAVAIDEALGKTVFAPWAKAELEPRSLIAYEQLRAARFVLEPRTLDALRAIGLEHVHVAMPGEPRERPHEGPFEVDVVECTMVAQGFRNGALVLMDLPGLLSGNAYARRCAEQWWMAADLAIFLTSSETPLSRADLEVLARRAEQSRGSVLLCITKCDRERQLSATEWEIRFESGDFERQHAFVDQVVRQAGLERLLARTTVIGVGSKLFEQIAREGGDRTSLERALRESRLDGLLRVLLEVARSEGVRRKSLGPLERGAAALRKVAAALDEARRQIEANRAAGEAGWKQLDSVIDRFEERAREELKALFLRKLDEAAAQVRQEVDAKRMRRSLNPSTEVQVTIGADEIAAAMQRAADAAGKELRERLEPVLTKLTSLRFAVKERWKRVVRTRRVRVD